MRNWRFRFLQAVLLLGLPLSAQAQSIELQAISDFTNRESGAVPYYLEIVGGRNALAINAANPAYRDRFARAEHEFLGPDGIYDITIHALGEIDGDGTYRLLVNGIVQGEAVNTPVDTDYTIIEHRFEGIALSSPVTIAVESKAVSNNQIPEGDGFAFARGRWRAVTLDLHQASEPGSTANVDVGISLSTIDALAQQGNRIPVIASVINYSQTTVASGTVVEIALPEGIQFHSSSDCSTTIQGASCQLAELSPGSVENVNFEADINAAGWQSISASVSSDQPDSNNQNNAANLAFEADPASPVIVTPEPASNPITIPVNSTTDTDLYEGSKKNDTVSGALGLQAILLLLGLGLSRARLCARLARRSR